MWHIICYSIFAKATLHTVAIVNYMLLLIIWLLVFRDVIGIIAFEIYKPFIEIDEYIWVEDIVYSGIVFNKLGIDMAVYNFVSK